MDDKIQFALSEGDPGFVRFEFRTDEGEAFSLTLPMSEARHMAEAVKALCPPVSCCAVCGRGRQDQIYQWTFPPDDVLCAEGEHKWGLDDITIIRCYKCSLIEDLDKERQ